MWTSPSVSLSCLSNHTAFLKPRLHLTANQGGTHTLVHGCTITNTYPYLEFVPISESVLEDIWKYHRVWRVFVELHCITLGMKRMSLGCSKTGNAVPNINTNIVRSVKNSTVIKYTVTYLKKEIFTTMCNDSESACVHYFHNKAFPILFCQLILTTWTSVSLGIKASCTIVNCMPIGRPYSWGLCSGGGITQNPVADAPWPPPRTYGAVGKIKNIFTNHASDIKIYHT